MPNDNLLSVTPIDGRYESQTKSLANYFSEFPLIKTRVETRVTFFIVKKVSGLVVKWISHVSSEHGFGVRVPTRPPIKYLFFLNTLKLLTQQFEQH